MPMSPPPLSTMHGGFGVSGAVDPISEDVTPLNGGTRMEGSSPTPKDDALGSGGGTITGQMLQQDDQIVC